MKRNMLAILIAGLMLTTVLSAFSVSAAKNIAEETASAGSVTTTDTLTTIGIYGHVYNIKTGNPIEGAWVIATWNTFPWTEIDDTNGDGFYELLGPIFGPEKTWVALKVWKLGYSPVERTVLYDRTEGEIYVNFYLTPIFPDPVTIPETVVSQSVQQSLSYLQGSEPQGSDQSSQPSNR